MAMIRAVILSCIVAESYAFGGQDATTRTPAFGLMKPKSGLAGNWGHSLLSTEEQAREPASNNNAQACVKDGASEKQQVLADAMSAMYNFEDALDVQSQYVRPEWEKCMGESLNAEEWKKNVAPNCLGPLERLLGTWIGSSGKAYTAVPQYGPLTADGEEAIFLADGVGAIPGQPTATFHAIKNQTYKEIMVFSPILGNVKNRGYADADPINPGCQADQVTRGVKYTLSVVQTSPDDADGEFGGVLHEETGMFLYNSIPATGGGQLKESKLFRMATVPHGVAILAEGSNGQEVTGPDAHQQLLAEQQARSMSTIPLPQNCIPDSGYNTAEEPWGTNMDGNSQGGSAPFTDITEFLTNQTKSFKSVSDYVHVVVAAPETSSTKFIRQQADTLDYKFDMWLSNVVDKDGKEQEMLQYSQSSMLVFQQRFDCIICEGGKRDANGCYTHCDKLDVEFTNPSGKSQFADFKGKTLNEMGAVQHHQCFNCKPDPACENEKGGGKMLWPHLQLNTLKKVTKDTPKEELEAFSGLEVFGSF